MASKRLWVVLGLIAGSGLRAFAVDEPPVPTGAEESIVVSSDAAKERQDPASFSDLDAQAIENLHVGQDLSTLLGDTMNAYSYSDAGNGYGYSYLRIRGFEQSRIAVNVNGVPLNTPESHEVYTIDLGDFAAGLGLVQIQRGPGTSLYGSPSVGGVVNLESAGLSTTAGGELELGAGSFGTSRVSLRYGGPIGTSHWAWAARAAHVQSDGYREPSWSRQTFAQVAFERFDDDSIWRILLFGGPEQTQLSYYGVPYPDINDPVLRRQNSLLPGETDNFFQPQLQVMNDRRIAPGVTLKNTVYAILGNGYFRQHADSYAYDPLGSAPPTPAYPEETINDAWLKRSLDNHQIGWIPRIAWAHPHGELSGGMELLFHRGQHEGTVTSGAICSDPSDPTCASTTPVGAPLGLYDYTNKKDTINVFAREAWRFAPNAVLDVELQATRHRFAMSEDKVRGASWNADYSFVTPRLGVNWNVTDSWNTYALVAKTESEPPFANVWDPEDTTANPADSFATIDPATQHYSDPFAKPERLTSVEAGAGYRKGATRLKMNLYWMQFRDELVYAGGLNSDGVPLTTNAGRSRHQGIEFEGAGRIPGDVDIAGYLAYSHDVLDDATLLSSDGAGGTIAIDYSGNRIALFPDLTARLSVARTFGIVRAELYGRHVGTIYTDNSQNERKTPENREAADYVSKKVDPFTLVGAQAVIDLSGYARKAKGSLTIRARIDNLLDAKVTQFGYSYPLDAAYTQFYSEFFPAATRSYWIGLGFNF